VPASDPAVAGTGSVRLDRRAWAALLTLCGALFLDALDVSMVGVALPSIRTDLGLSTGTLQWVVSAYVLGYGGFLLLGGRAADLLGRRRMFLVSLGVFVVASALGGLVDDGSLLIATRFVKGVSAAFTAPAGLSIITTSFAEGPIRNKALAVYTATGAVGFSLGLVVGGLLTEIGWRWVFLLPVPVAIAILVVAIRVVPDPGRPAGPRRSFDLAGATTITAGMLLLVYSVVEAPDVGWGTARTLGGVAAAAALIGAFVAAERRSAHPLVRLGIFRSGSLVRANLGAMALFGSWVGFQFILTLYLQGLRGWSPLETGLAIFPAGAIVAVIAPRMGAVVARVGLRRPIALGLTSAAVSYGLFLPIGIQSGYALAVLPTMVLGGLGFALAFGPLNMAATNGIEAHEQGLAGGLVNTSFQFGGALVLAVVTAVDEAATSGTTPQAIMDGYRPAVMVSLIAAALGVVATVAARRRRPAAAPEVVAVEVPVRELVEG
jgi:EmrB/QacA subfamily drug resistance transporter